MDIINAITDGRLEHITPSGMIFLSIIDVAIALWDSTTPFHILNEEGKVQSFDYMRQYLKTLTFRWMWMIGNLYFYRRIFISLISDLRNLGLLAVGILVCMLVGVLTSPIAIETLGLTYHFTVGYDYVLRVFLLICAVGGILDVLFVVRSPGEVTAMMSFWVTMLIVHSVSHFVHSKFFYTNKIETNWYSKALNSVLWFIFR
ncbi:unnamed protein product [Orchesella dallaii]|uniref:Uncharacterized protein n=1 Tax=Orchesella dallaii TaxID=48710 RepID=A0ABP1R9D5_9HEXA